MPTVTQATYLRTLIDRLYPDADVRYGTASAATTTTFTDASTFLTSFTQTSAYIGQWVRISGTTLGGTQYAKVYSIDRTTGVVTLDRTITQPTGTITYEITGPRKPDQLERMIDNVLENCYTPSTFPLSSVIVTGDDNDMEASGTSAWAAVFGGSVSLSKVTSGTILPYISGTQSLSLTSSTAITDGAQVNATSDYLVAHEGETCFASILCAAAASTQEYEATFAVGDATETPPTLIDSVTMAQKDGVAWQEMSFTFTMPADSHAAITPVIYNSNTSAFSYWKDLIMTRVGQRIFPTPSWLTKPAQMIDVIAIPQGTGIATERYRTLESNTRSVPWKQATSDIRTLNEVAIEIFEPADKRMYIYAKRPGVALTANTSTGYVDVAIVVENCLKLIEAQDSEGGRLATWRILANLRESSLAAGVEQPTQHSMAYFA